MIRQLPLFPLGSILFPGATINLHIFEERYRQMIGRCLEEQSPFGVVLIRQGDEVEEGRLGARPAEPYNVGTVAEISANVRLEDGRFLLTAVGRERFRIQHVIQRAPYLIASVLELPEVVAPSAAAAEEELRATYERYWQAVAAATGVPVQPEDLPVEPMELAYYLADRLQVPAARKQHWLESSLITRLREITGDMRTELALMPTGKRATGEGFSGMGSLN
ncbi:MAG: LON peptidase substrate-binding domain-containing protein [Chloroflexales bacterium]|nr:LON peptidase substrate-binding domain-containing protein [Chloroflexales bacterium]